MVGLARCRRGGGYEPEAAFRVASLLPTLGYTFDFPFYHGAIARVFATAHVALWAAFGRLPSQPPLVCVQVSGFRSDFFPFGSHTPQLKSNSKILHQWCLIIDTPEC